MKSVRSLSKTIEGLIGREKDKISELCRDTHRSTFERVFPEGSPTLKEQSRLGELLISQVNQQRAALHASTNQRDLRPAEVTNDSIYSYRNHSSEQESYANSFEDPNPLKKSQLVVPTKLAPPDKNGTPQFDQTNRGVSNTLLSVDQSIRNFSLGGSQHQEALLQDRLLDQLSKYDDLLGHYEGLQLAHEALLEEKARLKASYDRCLVEAQDAHRRGMLLQEEKRLLAEKAERVEVVLREEHLREMRTVAEQYETQVRHLSEQLGLKDQALASMQRQFDQIDSQITSVSGVAGRYEEAQRQVQ